MVKVLGHQGHQGQESGPSYNGYRCPREAPPRSKCGERSPSLQKEPDTFFSRFHPEEARWVNWQFRTWRSAMVLLTAGLGDSPSPWCGGGYSPPRALGRW